MEDRLKKRLAKQLHREAGVKEGRQRYKLIGVDYVSSAIIFRGNVEDYSKVIYLVKHEAHYNGLRSMIAFLNRSYFCPECCKGYDVDDAAHHTCLGRNCSSC